MAFLPALFSAGVQAMSIGEINVTSHLGEPLRAKVPVSLDEGALPRDECVRLVGPARAHPDLADAQLSLIGENGRYQVLIRTDRPVNDPMLDLTLRSEGCGATLQKDFVILLSPRAVPAPVVARPVPPVVSAPASTVAKAAPAKPATSKPAAAKPAVKKARPLPARKPSAPSGRAPGGFVFRLDYDHTAFGQLAERIVRERQAAHRSTGGKPTAGAASAPPASAQAVPAPGAAGTPEPAPPQNDRLVLQPVPEETAATAPLTAGTAADGQPGQTGNGGTDAGESEETGLATPTAPADGPFYSWVLDNYNVLLPVLLVLLALTVALWLKQRRPQSRFMDKTATELEDLLPVNLEENRLPPAMSSHLPPADEAFIEPPEAKTLLGEALEPRPPSGKAEPLEFDAKAAAKPLPTDMFSVEQHDTFDHIMELAEVMLAFGRSSQAIDALSQHIRDNPRQSIDPWLKLLDLYHQSNLRTEFEALASDLHKYYNIAIIEWDEFGASPLASHDSGPLSLESLPHVMAQLSSHWGTQAGLDYLNRLLADNRGGQRLGFAMPIVRDILFLRDILRQVCAVTA